jgi:hypothetical protein
MNPRRFPKLDIETRERNKHPDPTSAELRRDVDAFIARGGAVKQIPNGASGERCK